MATFKNFVPFHVHPLSLDSASTPDTFVKREVELETGHVALTDHGSLAAVKTMFDLANKGPLDWPKNTPWNKLTFSPGIEGYFRDDRCPILRGLGVPHTMKTGCGQCGVWWKADGPDCDCGPAHRESRPTFRDSYFKYAHVTMHFRTYEAYLCAVRLLTKRDLTAERHGQERKPIFDWADMEELAGHDVTIGSGCLIGIVSRHLMAKDSMEGALAYYRRFRELFAGRFYVEIFPHDTSKNWVDGVRLTFEDGTKKLWYHGKKLRVSGVELEANELARQFPRGQLRVLQAVKNRNTWEEQDPKTLVQAEAIEDFIQNEYKPWCDDGNLQAACNQFLIELARAHGDPMIVSDDAHYARPKDKVVQDVRLAQSGTWRFYGSYHRHSSDEAFRHFQQTLGMSEVEFERMVDNGREWASTFGKFKFPNKPLLPEKFYPGDPVERVMETIVRVGRMRWDNPVYVDRLSYELDLFSRNGKFDNLPVYWFPIVEMVEYYAELGELCGPGRGSAAGVLMSYLLGITHADPIRYKLSIDRFMTPDRIISGKLPDIDQDFPRMEPLMDKGGFLDRRFGKCYARISADTKLKLRSSVKDVHRAKYGHVSPDVEALTKRFEEPMQGVSDRDHAFGRKGGDGTWVPGAVETDPALKEYVEKYPQEWDLVVQCLSLFRNKTKHACAHIIASVPIGDIIPLTQVGGTTVTSYTAESVEAVGGVKYDLLCVNSLLDCSIALKLIQSRCGREIPQEVYLNDIKVPGFRLIPVKGGWADVWDLPEDRRVYSDIMNGRTDSVFQLTTPAAKQGLKAFNHCRPDGRPLIDNVMDMSVFTALDRPGPLDKLVRSPDGRSHNMLVEYARRARGLPGSPDVPAIMVELLPETFGVNVFQEQVQYSYQQLTGCTGADAENFRRLVAKKETAKMVNVRDSFIEKVGVKVGAEQAAKIWEFYVSFSNYGFNLSHSLCYSLIGYACAYLKHHYPLEWWCAVLQNAKKEEIADKFWPYCGRMVLMPDISHSGETFQIEGDRIRAPLWLVDGVGPGARTELETGKPYATIRDLCTAIFRHKASTAKTTPADGDVESKTSAGHSALNRGVIYKLILAGALDTLFPPEATLIGKMEAYERTLAEVQQAATSKKGKPQPIDRKLLDVDAIGRYQMIKEVLPVYSGALLTYFPASMMMRAYGDKLCLRRSGDPVEFVGSIRLGELSSQPLNDEKLIVAVGAYIQDARPFTHKDHVRWELLVDIEGGRHSMVYWGRKKDGGELKPGSVAALVLSRSSDEYGFSVLDWVLVRAPLKDAVVKKTPMAVKLIEDSGRMVPPPGAVDCTRPGFWGNPYSHIKNSQAQFHTKTVEEAVRAFETWLPTQPEHMARLPELAGKDLACVCPPKKGWFFDDVGGYRCHVQVLLRMANSGTPVYQEKPQSPFNIFSNTEDGPLAAALTNPTTLSFARGRIPHQYPVTVEGVSYQDAEEAYQTLKPMATTEDEQDQIMVVVIAAKFHQYPELLQQVVKAGGVDFLSKCSHKTGAKTKQVKAWEGVGMGSRYIRNLVGGLKAALATR